MHRIRQAMLLGAGFSKRLRPLTDEIPKPMLSFLDATLLDYSLRFLEASDISSVAVNVHHGRRRFQKALQPYKQVKPFFEENILGTGGGIKNMSSFVTDDHFVVANCDTFLDLDLRQAFQFHLQKSALATMILVPPPEVGTYSSVGIDREGQIVEVPAGRPPGGASQRGLFSGAHIFRRDIFEQMPAGPNFCIVRDVYADLVSKRAPVFGFFRNVRWIDAGETILYAQAQLELLRQPMSWMSFEALEEHESGVQIAPQAKVAPDLEAKPPLLLAAGVQVGSKTTLGSNVIVGKHARIGAGCQLRNSVVLAESRLKANTRADGVLFWGRGNRETLKR